MAAKDFVSARIMHGLRRAPRSPSPTASGHLFAVACSGARRLDCFKERHQPRFSRALCASYSDNLKPNPVSATLRPAKYSASVCSSWKMSADIFQGNQLGKARKLAVRHQSTALVASRPGSLGQGHDLRFRAAFQTRRSRGGPLSTRGWLAAEALDVHSSRCLVGLIGSRLLPVLPTRLLPFGAAHGSTKNLPRETYSSRSVAGAQGFRSGRLRNPAS